jgi:acyl-CoA synthetase (AMP-forming)/AMP-acid ligase II
LRNDGVGSWIARRARRTPDRIAVIHAGDRLSYAGLHDRITRLAHGLRGIGAGRGDRVAYLGPNHPAFLETLFAAGTLGAILVPLNTRLAVPELARHLADSGARALIYGAGQAQAAAALRAAAPGIRDVVALDEPAGGELSYRDLLAGGGPEIDEPVTQDDPFLIMYTSGTTGGAKGATLSHGNITWNAINVVVDADFRHDEIALVVAPLFHTAALNMLCLPAILKGGAVLIEPGFEPGRALELIESQKVTSLFGVPAVYDAMAAHPRWAGADLSSLRMLLCGGAPVPEATIRGYTSRGLAFIQGYGMTETSPGALLLDAAHVESKAGSAGVPHFFTDVRVVHPDLTPAAPGETGEIVVAGPNVMQGYWNQPEATAKALLAWGGTAPSGDGFLRGHPGPRRPRAPDGPGTPRGGGGTWLRSGDAGTADGDGYVFVVDRIKDMIISGGENIYPAEVENVLRDHPAVADCGVIGVPDTRWGEVGRAVVVLRPGAEVTEAELLAFLDGRIARFKIPKSVRFTDGLPRTGTGKILKKRLRETHGGASPGGATPRNPPLA